MLPLSVRPSSSASEMALAICVLVFLVDQNYYSFSFKTFIFGLYFQGVRAYYCLVLTLGLTIHLRLYLMQVGVSNLRLSFLN